MKKVIFNMKAFYISLFVVLFFPLGLMGQQAINTMINTGNIVCFESNKMMMAVDIYPEFEDSEGKVRHPFAGLPYLSARTKNDQVWGDMTIWWEATSKGFRNLTYGCYLKFDPNTKTYAVATYEDPDGEGPEVPRAYSELDATSIGFVTATQDAKVLVKIKTLLGTDANSFDNKSSWYVGKISYDETINYEESYYEWLVVKKWRKKTFTNHVNEYYRPQYVNGEWVARANVGKRKLTGYDLLDHNEILKYTETSQLLSFLFEKEIRNQGEITYSPTIILGGVEFGVVQVLLSSFDMRTMMAFFCPPTDAQAYMLNNFNIVHQKGASAPIAEYQIPIENLQPVHTHTEVIYAAEGADVHLRLQVEDTRSYPLNWNDMENSYLYQYTANKYLDGYYRWFNYENENDIKTINEKLKHIRAKATWGMQLGATEEFKYFKTNKGDVLLKGFGPGKTTFEMGTTPVKIACDVSNYSDYKFSFVDGVITCTEPTLSYRIIYDIRPASEMVAKLDAIKGAKKVDDKTPFESYNIVAPAGENVKIGPKYRWWRPNSNSVSPSNYFYTLNNKIQQILTSRWYKNRSEYSYGDVIDERLITIKAPADGVTDIYEVYNYDLDVKIAEFKVTGRAKDKVGPFMPEKTTDSIHFPEYIDEKYLDLEYNQTFDRAASYLFEDPLGVNVTENEAEDNWNEISYGFVYYDFDNKQGDNSATKVNPNNSNNDITKTKRGRLGHANKVYMPHWSEYFFAVNTNGLQPEIFNVISHGSTPKCNNRYLYCSGTSTPGKVADFVINGNLCPASKIFLSVWVVHMYDVKYITNSELGDAVYPNLNFSIIGVMKDGTETPITTFTTGDLDTKGEWHHILFEFETTQVDYDQYRIRIENNNASLYNIGNEFGIDDIRVYTTTKTAATVNQKFMGCPTWDVKNPTVIGKSNIALLRADLSNTPSENTTMYYSWLKSEGVNDTIHLQLENYLGTNTIGGSHTLYGDVEVKKDWTDNEVPSGRLYASVDEYLSVKDVDLKADVFVDYFFTREDGDLILYIVHKDILFQQNEKYYSLVTADKARVEEHNTPEKVIEFYQNLQCGSLSYFEVLPYSRAFLAKGTDEKYDYDFTEAITKHLAKGETYKFVVEAYSPVVIDGKDTIVSYNCAADWLLVNGMSETEKWTNVENIIKWRKGDVNKPNLGDKLTDDVTSYAVTMSETEPFMHYVVIPYPGSTKDEGEPCVVPFELLLYDSIPATLADPNVSAAVEEGENVWKYDRPAAICNEPIIVRIPNSLEGKENIALNLDIDYFDEYLFAEIAKYNAQEGNTNLYPLNNIYLYDANGQQVATNITTTAKDENNKPITLDLLKKDDDVAISGGHDFASGQKYHFAGHNQIDGVKITPPFQFDVYVVPDEVTWTGEQGTAWHNDDNWNPKFIPMSHTDVVIPGNTVNKPVLNPAEGEFEAGAYKWLEHDIVAESKGDNNLLVEAQSEDQSDDLSAVLNSCNDIYFAVGAELANQHMLNYERAFVDVPFAGDNFGKSTANYKIMSFPLRNVYRGDLYIPKAGDGSFAFASPADVDNRAYNSFYVKAYNSAIQKNTISGDKTKPEAEKVVEVEDYTYATTGGWSNPTSVLNFEFEEAHGYAVSLNATTTAQRFVRLPKLATEYYLFMNFGNGNEKPLHGSTWPKYEISWEADSKREAHNGREFGHKLVYDKEHGASVTFTNKQGNIFLIGNPFMTGMSVEKFLEVNNLTSNVYYTYIDGIIEVDKMSNETDKKIPPFEAMFVQGKSTIQKFTFTPEMMSYTESSTSTQQRALRMVEERELLTITAEVNGARSRTYIEKDFAANNEYLDTEDADLLVLDADLTPISVYSVATGAALAYNSVTDMDFVPLGLLLVDSTIVAESVTFTFDGVDYFYDELYLYDALYNSYLPLIDGVALELEMPESGELRYFVTDTKRNVGGGVATSDDLVEDTKVCIFTTDGEACIIADDIISEATVYDIAGRLIYYSDQISSSQHNISLPNGVYMLKVVVNSNLSTHKIILK